jgi:topoisomerase-4 subunit A
MNFLFDCSDLDDIIAFTKRGIMKVVKVADKSFIGKIFIHVAVFQKNDERTTYNK